MDCEKFESTLMDELYGELDELTSAASKRHVAGCARCASLLHGLSATRRIAVLELVEPPPGLEQRILAATKEAQKVVPLGGRVSRVVSWAGSWAMRPQTAMAAVFLLMIGTTSVLLLRARHFDSASMVVTEKGAPAASFAPEAQEQDQGAFDTAHGAGAHGAFEAHKAPGPISAQGSAASAMVAKDDDQAAAGTLGASASSGAPASSSAEDKERRMRGPVALAPTMLDEKSSDDNSSPANAAAAPAGAPPAGAYGAAAAAPRAAGTTSPASQPPPPPADTRAESKAMATGASSGSPSFDAAMTSYRAKNYGDATRAFDALAAAGDVNAALMAARSVRDANGCAEALPRYNAVIARAYGTQAGYDASLEAGRCERSTGAVDAARSQFASLLTVPSHAGRAQAELDQMSPRAPAHASKPAAKSPAMPPPAKK